MKRLLLLSILISGFVIFGCIYLTNPELAGKIGDCKSLKWDSTFWDGKEHHVPPATKAEPGGYDARKMCLYDLAEKYNDPAICDEISGIYDPDAIWISLPDTYECRLNLAIKNHNPDLCAKSDAGYCKTAASS